MLSKEMFINGFRSTLISSEELPQRNTPRLLRTFSFNSRTMALFQKEK